ncbi:hypothetical protein R3W88_031299 [Solanum pinnatisectum]|uniref:Reverse transcriptase zinc-binding domain-containing protein n=1 Tax=Solanum pinnatisectum TaxID=50273 RepID=A0AAV9LKZ7_9SOLN|nr:hypothetical protein R3W88_031299 [Solanum pinnatisectum]
MVRKILQMHKELKDIGWNEEYVNQIDKFSIKQLYKALRVDYQKVEWRRLTCNNAACPKWIFISYLALQSRLLTRDRLATWGCAEDVHCVLCGTEDESHNHIFFRCLFSSQVWQNVLCWQSIHREARGWEEEITWLNAQCKGKQTRAEVLGWHWLQMFILFGRRGTNEISKRSQEPLQCWQKRCT